MEKYIVTGMNCAACSARVEKAVREVDGVTACSVNLLTGDMQVDGEASEGAVIAAVRAAGYGASRKRSAREAKLSGGEEPKAEGESALLLRRLLLSLAFLLVLMYLSMGRMLSLPLPSALSAAPAVQGVLQMLLSAAVLVINGRFFVSGTKALLRRAPNMDTLVAMGSGVAFGYSVYVCVCMCLAPQEAHALLHGLYFESAAMIVTLITVGKLLEARAKGKTTSALSSLMKLAPQTACVLRNREETVIPADEVVIGDTFLVRPGEAIPVDGTVLSGEGAVNESALTGESIPVDKVPGDTVRAGTLNCMGFLTCRADSVGEDTALAKIIQMVSDSSAGKAPIAKTADRVSAVFVPSVILIAALTTIGWLIAKESLGFALARGISVLVISCPCALGLATPVAIMVGSGVGARAGILFKTAAALEQAGRIRAVALDKTGTVTEGKPRVTDLVALGAADETELLSAAYAAENKSEHPLARAICEAAEERGLPLANTEEFLALPGNGLSCLYGGQRLCGGKRRFIEQFASISSEAAERAEAFAKEGKTPIFFSLDSDLLGIVAVADSVKEDSAGAVKRLRRMGLYTVMLTGDNARTAERIGALVGVDEVRAEILPEEKEAAVREIEKKHGAVAMVGDGINDALALTSASLGIAIGAGTDVAIDAADTVLVKNRLSDVPAAIALGRAVLRNIRQNLFWAFCYNVIGIPLAAGLFGLSLSPMFGAAAMSLSSFCVVTNALRLNFLRLHEVPAGSSGGEESELVTTAFSVEGMMCEHCEKRVQDAILALGRVKTVRADYRKKRVSVTHEKSLTEKELRRAVKNAGYRPAGEFRG